MALKYGNLLRGKKNWGRWLRFEQAGCNRPASLPVPPLTGVRFLRFAIQLTRRFETWSSLGHVNWKYRRKLENN